MVQTSRKRSHSGTVTTSRQTCGWCSDKGNHKMIGRAFFCVRFVFIRCVSSVGLECLPVTQEVTGSSPVHTANRMKLMPCVFQQSRMLYCTKATYLLSVSFSVNGEHAGISTRRMQVRVLYDTQSAEISSVRLGHSQWWCDDMRVQVPPVHINDMTVAKLVNARQLQSE